MRTRFLLCALPAAAIGGYLLIHPRNEQPPPKAAVAMAPLRDSAVASTDASPIDDRHALASKAIDAPALRARKWMARSRRVASARNERQFGPAIAQALDKTPADAWTALTERARDGDATAAAAALLLANECKVLSQQIASIDADHGDFLAHFSAGLPQDWQSFLHAIDAEQHQRLDARVASCADVEGVWDFVSMALDRFMQPPDEDAQLEQAGDDDDDHAIADLREIANTYRDRKSSVALGKRLMQSRNPANQRDGRTLLESLAADDGDVISFLAGCFRAGCGFFHADTTVADAWVEHAAGLGEWWALGTRITDLQAAQQPAAAWAWALYRLDLADAGCFESGQPQLMYVAQSARDAFALEQGLSAAGQTQGRATASAIAIRWEAQAAARLACAA